MYTKQVPFKDFNNKPRNQAVNFNLTEVEVFKLLVPLQGIFKWVESIQDKEMREIPTEEVVDFYNNFESVLLAAWGEPSEDGLHFRKAGRYDFEESALFAASMLEFVTNPPETMKLLDALMPAGLQDIVKNADANLVAAAALDGTPESQQETIAKLRAQLAEQQATAGKNLA